MRREGSWWRVRFRSWRYLREVTGPNGAFATAGLKVWEADVNPVRRFLTDNDVEIQRPRRCYLDLEVDARRSIPEQKAGNARVLCWALADDLGTKTYGLLEADDDEAETLLLQDLWHELLRYDQVCAWGLDRYDEPVLKNRSEKLGIVIEPRRWLWCDQMEVYKRYNMSASASGAEKESVALDRVAEAVVGRGKAPLDARFTFEIWQSDPMRLVDYNVEDVVLAREIERETGYLDLHFTVCQVCNTLPDSRGAHPTNFVEGYMLRLGLQHDQRFPTFYDYALGEGKFAGAYVMEPTRTGIIEGVHVCDFAGLYPSIIISWNMSPETLTDVELQPDVSKLPSYLRHGPPRTTPLPAGHCVAPLTGRVFRTDETGLLVIALERLREMREEYKQRRAAEPPGTPRWKEFDRLCSAYKIAANSFYGVVGSVFSRFFVRAVAESITQTGKWLLLKTLDAASARGFELFAGDTDSLFVVGGTDEKFRAFVDWCNAELYPGLLRECGCVRNIVRLGYEKKFSRMVMVKKKRYAAVYEHFEGTPATADSKPEIKGLEYKRGDTLRLARELQHQVLLMLLRERVEDCESYRRVLLEWRTRILKHELQLPDVRMSQQLSRDPRAYSRRVRKDGTFSALPVHVVVALQLAELGRDIGEGVRIEYVVVDGRTPLRAVPADQYDGTVDRYYLWESMIYPPTQRVLEAALPGHRWRDYLRVRPSRGGPAGVDALGQVLLF